MHANSYKLGIVTIKDKDNLIMLNKSDWEEIGELMEWDLKKSPNLEDD